MKKILLAVVCICFLSGCSVFKRKTGCPTDGKSVGAEKILSGDKKSAKAVRKAKKFNS
jgi:uncharacterized protein YceK